MCCKNFWQRIIPFALALMLGFWAANILPKENTDNKSLRIIRREPSISRSETKSLQIISKPKPDYTDAARQNQVQGTVTLRVTFAASGEIGNVSPVSNLPYGLTEQAISAARNIRFEPAERNGIPQTVTKQVQYNFTIY